MMPSPHLPAPRRRLRGAASSLALAAAALLGTTVAIAPVHAQNNQQQAAQPTAPSPTFGAVYNPVVDAVNAPGADLAAARAQLPAVYAAIVNEDDRHAAGNLALVLGNKLEDVTLQRQGLEMMLRSGKVAPERVGEFHYFLGTMALNADDYAAARAALQAAIAAGTTEDDVGAMIAETYFGEGQHAQGLTYLSNAIEQREAAGQPVPENWLLRGLRIAYENDLADQAADYAFKAVAANPTQASWLRALQVVNAMYPLEPAAQLDLLRLMAATNSLSERRDYSSYIDIADVRIMSNEVLRVLNRGLEQGVFAAGDSYYTDVRSIAEERAPIDRREAPGLAAEARTAANGRAALNAGDVFLSIEDYAQAEAMYRLAMEKGGVDNNTALTRLGISQAHQGKAAEAKSTLNQVTGNRSPVARAWIAYVDGLG